jgi:hypothetical protein
MKKIAAPRPLKRSGVVPTVRAKFARAEYFRDDEDTGRNDHEELYNDLANGEEEGVMASFRRALLDDESVEMEGSCEIQRIFLSGFHTPGPRGANDDEDEDVTEGESSRLYFVNDRASSQAQSPSFQFFIPTAASRYSQHDDSENEATGGDDISSNFPLLGHSPNHRSNSGDDEDENSFFDSYPIYPRATNPMPLNTPFHASATNEAPAYAGYLYDNQHVVVGARGHFYTLPSGGARPQLKGAADATNAHNWVAGVEENDPHGDAGRATRNRSYSEPIPFVPAAPAPTRG